MRTALSPKAASIGRPLALLLMLAATLLLALGGCASLKKTLREAASENRVKKKIGLTYFENRTGVDPKAFAQNFDRRLDARIVEGSPDTLLVTPENKTFLDYLTKLPRLPSGLVNNLALAESGRKYGFDAVVSGSLLEMKVEKEVSGLLWFKKSVPTIELLVGVEVYDTETGAKILDERFSRKSEISEIEEESLQAGQGTVRPILNELLRQLADTAAESICDALDRLPWKGFIISTRDDKVILSAGKDSGLLPGDVLQVRDSVQVISGYEGQQFFLPGIKIGEIRITAVYPNRSEAVVASGKDIREGCTVELQ